MKYHVDLDSSRSHYKIQRMSEAADGHPLAIASGVTPDNVNDYLPYINAFLVSTGISKDFHNLDLEKTKELMEKIKNYHN